jgi:hypothetical protein
MSPREAKLHAVTDAIGRPIRLFMTAGEVKDHAGARALVSSLSATNCLLGDRGYDTDWFRVTFLDKDIVPCIPNVSTTESVSDAPLVTVMRTALPDNGKASLEKAQQDRNHVRVPEGLATLRDALRQILRRVPLGHRHRPRRNRKLLFMRPDLRQLEASLHLPSHARKEYLKNGSNCVQEVICWDDPLSAI